MKTLLVIGDNPDERCRQYSADTKVEPYVKFRFDDASSLKQKEIKALETILNSPLVKLTEKQYEVYRNLYLDIKGMDDTEFFERISEGLEIDDKTGNAYSTENPNGRFMYQKCYDKRLRETGEESPFSNPFKLHNGEKAYSALNKEIDWSKNHMNNTGIYRAAWEICVEGREPENETEEIIKTNMSNRHEYFANFKDVDEYINHSCCFWTNSVITEDNKFYELDYKTSDKEWIKNFFERFIKPLDDNTLLTIYEVRSVNL